MARKMARWISCLVLVPMGACDKPAPRDKSATTEVATPVSARAEFEAFVATELRGAGSETSTSRIFRYCRRDGAEAADIVLDQASRIDPQKDPYIYGRVNRLARRLPFTNLGEALIPKINDPEDKDLAALAASMLSGYQYARPASNLYIAEDVSEITSEHFADYVFGDNLHRALQRYAHGPEAPEDDSQRRTFIREVLLADHLVADVTWRRRHGYEVSDEAITDCIERLRALSKSEFWWARRFVAQVILGEVNVGRPLLVDTEIVDRLKADQDERVSNCAQRISL